MGLCGGLLTGWNPKVLKVRDFLTFASILVEASYRGFVVSLSCLNCYGPYHDREVFWEAIMDGFF